MQALVGEVDRADAGLACGVVDMAVERGLATVGFQYVEFSTILAYNIVGGAIHKLVLVLQCLVDSLILRLRQVGLKVGLELRALLEEVGEDIVVDVALFLLVFLAFETLVFRQVCKVYGILCLLCRRLGYERFGTALVFFIEVGKYVVEHIRYLLVVGEFAVALPQLAGRNEGQILFL